MNPKGKVLKTYCTSAEAAQLLGVALRTVQLWSEAGLLKVWKTAGGHRRIERQSIERLLVGQNKRSTDRPQVASNGQRRPLKILVVEDDPSLRTLYEINLTRWAIGPEVACAGDGYEALIRMGHTKPDLVILDMNMPGMDGFRMLQTMRSVAELAHTAVVVVSGLDAAELKSRGGLPDNVPVFPKPVPFDQLRALAEQLANPLHERLVG